MSTPTRKGFTLLLSNLNPVPDGAAEKYEELRLRLVKYFELSYDCPEVRADELADKTLDRVALKLEQGTVIEKIGAYARRIADYIWLENKDILREDSLDERLAEVSDKDEEIKELDERKLCLRQCLNTAFKNRTDHNLVIEYLYGAEGEKNKDHRKKLAQSLGISSNTLKVRAFRLRRALEKCVKECVKKKKAL